MTGIDREGVLNSMATAVHERRHSPLLLYYQQPHTLLTCNEMSTLAALLEDRWSFDIDPANAANCNAAYSKTELLVVCRVVYPSGSCILTYPSTK